ncbi:MAG: cytochrome C oxidase subunit IV family protein [Lutibacter sp.]|nr:cytochrome C oxidase subunit IV family protein [Lutibacter sp.]
MKVSKLTIVWISLLVLTICSAILSNSTTIAFASLFILILAAIKFMIVAFYFMEMKKAHVFWKIFISGFLLLFVGVLSMFI